jgi:hypothetical protein
MNKNSIQSEENSFDLCGWILIICSYILMIISFPVTVFFCINVCRDYLLVEKMKRMCLFRLWKNMNER